MSSSNGCKPAVLPALNGEALSTLAPTALEAEHVHKVYDSIAPHFSHTRHHPWPLVTDFLTALPAGSLVADVGCGNGKYLKINPALCMIGSDRSIPLLACSAQNEASFNVFGCDALKVPMRTGAFDAAISIAVLHHISTVERRIALISELARIVRVGGEIFIVAWAFEQDESSKRQFEQQDVMVEWKLQQNQPAGGDGESDDSDDEVDDIGGSVLRYARRCISTGEFSQAIGALSKVLEVCDFDSVASRQVRFCCVQLLSLTNQFDAALHCMMELYQEMPPPYATEDAMLVLLALTDLQAQRVTPEWLSRFDSILAFISKHQQKRRAGIPQHEFFSSIHARVAFQLDKIQKDYVQQYGQTLFGERLSQCHSILTHWRFENVDHVVERLQAARAIGIDEEKQRNLEFFHVHGPANKVG
ncbi:hypothetical protein Poli38472_000767 [Pythium oligandrum]|uniref:Methyltransferase type 11 domain-containing protein n=1 Tax=Pythium oligandrum TaxID=41045 RepID=A0A8K1CDC8_PYTOL|nr:hypothetical protein Poli38472_000767 [Pythium oligandrum]|eukprot:TMW60725.1 hypothetical protein Poli38472_000767 [Pythium oligandrum]